MICRAITEVHNTRRYKPIGRISNYSKLRYHAELAFHVNCQNLFHVEKCYDELFIFLLKAFDHKSKLFWQHYVCYFSIIEVRDWLYKLDCWDGLFFLPAGYFHFVMCWLVINLICIVLMGQNRHASVTKDYLNLMSAAPFQWGIKMASIQPAMCMSILF